MVFTAKCFVSIAAVLLLLTLFQLSTAYASSDESAEQGMRRRGLGKLGKNCKMTFKVVNNEKLKGLTKYAKKEVRQTR